MDGGVWSVAVDIGDNVTDIVAGVSQAFKCSIGRGFVGKGGGTQYEIDCRVLSRTHLLREPWECRVFLRSIAIRFPSA